MQMTLDAINISVLSAILDAQRKSLGVLEYAIYAMLAPGRPTTWREMALEIGFPADVDQYKAVSKGIARLRRKGYHIKSLFGGRYVLIKNR